MKTHCRSYRLRIAGTLSALSLCLAAVDAKPGKGKGPDQGGKAPHSNKQKKPKGHDGPSASKEPKGQAAKRPDKPDDKRGGPQGKHSAEPRWDDDARRGARFGEGDRGRILGYFGDYRDKPHGLPPGLAKNLNRGKRLPPGWQKKLAPGYRIDDGWWPAFEPVPYGWFPGVPTVPSTGLYWYGDRLVRVYEPRREIIDVIVVPTIRIDL